MQDTLKKYYSKPFLNSTKYIISDFKTFYRFKFRFDIRMISFMFRLFNHFSRSQRSQCYPGLPQQQ